MTRQNVKCSGRKKKTPVKSQDVLGAKYLRLVRKLLKRQRGHRADPKRRLHYDDLCAWLLLYFFSPVVDSLRGLQQASDIKTLRRRLNLPRFSLGSFSEAAAVFDPALLEPIIADLSARMETAAEAEPSLRSLKRRPTAVDGTLIRALPSMVWALWLDDEHRAAKLHLQFDLLKGAPEKPALTHAQAAETNALRQRLEPGRLYVTDRGYFDYSLMAAILTAHSSFVARARNNLVYDVIEERPLSDAARQRGVEADHIVRVGCPKNRDQLERPLRLVRLRVQSQGPPRGAGRVDHKSKLYRTRDTEHLLTLLTDQLDLDVELIALLYRQRWQIELFFRWFKTILQADTLLSRSKNGLTIIIYCALIASQLVVLWTGRKPTKRTYEMLCFYFSGWASDDDLAAHLERLETSAPSH